MLGRNGVGCRRNLKAALALVAGIVLLSSCRKWDNPYDPVGNHPPAVPKYPNPADSSVRANVGLVLSWHSYDPDSGDTAYFDIYIGTDSPPSLVQTGRVDTTFQPTALAGSTRYFWRIRAYDNHGDDTTGPIWQFTTAAPVLVTAPDTGQHLSINSQDTIIWIGGPLVGVDSTLVYWSADDGASWIRLGLATTLGQFIWQVPSPVTGSARVKVTDYVPADSLAGISGRFAIQDTTSLGPPLSARQHGRRSGQPGGS